MNLLINTLQSEIERAKKSCARCPRCLNAVTIWQSVWMKNGVIYHSKCRPW